MKEKVTLERYLEIHHQDNKERTLISKEPIERYRNIWNDLLNGTLIKSFKLEFEKKFEFEKSKDYNDSFYSIKFPYTEENKLTLLKNIGWRKEPYDKQHWGIWLHSLSPYQGRITPSFAHWLIKIFTKKDDVVFDPFCGVGTIPLEAALLRRIGIGNDLNPYAFLISKAKFDINTYSLEDNLKYLRDLSFVDYSRVDLSHVPEWIKDYFHDDTLKEIIYLKERFREDKQNFLLGCLMGILHGNRPGYLSVYTGCIIPMKPRKKDHPKYRPDKDAKQYRAVIPRLAAKVLRMFQQRITFELKGRILQEDTRNLSLEDNSVDVIISSPPYYNTLDYVNVNKVRLYFLGYEKEAQNELKERLIQRKKDYLEEMKKVGIELRRVLKKGHYLVFVLGDVHYSKSSINTAANVAKIYEDLGFKFICIVNDEIPLNKTASRTKRKKFDRILVMKNE